MQAMTASQLLQAFPDDEAAEQLFVSRRWPDGVVCPYCEDRDVQEGTAHPQMPFRLPRLWTVFLGTHGNGHAEVQDRLSGLADRHAPGADERHGQGRSQAGPRTGDYAEVGVASGLSDSCRVRRETRGDLSGGVVKTASITHSSDAGMDGGTWGRWSRFLCAAVRVDDLDIAVSCKSKAAPKPPGPRVLNFSIHKLSGTGRPTGQDPCQSRYYR